MVSSFSYFSAVLEKSTTIPHQVLSLNHNLKEFLISKDLQIIRKKVETVLTSIYSSYTVENFKTIL